MKCIYLLKALRIDQKKNISSQSVWFQNRNSITIPSKIVAKNSNTFCHFHCLKIPPRQLQTPRVAPPSGGGRFLFGCPFHTLITASSQVISKVKRVISVSSAECSSLPGFALKLASKDHSLRLWEEYFNALLLVLPMGEENESVDLIKQKVSFKNFLIARRELNSNKSFVSLKDTLSKLIRPRKDILEF